MSKYKGYDLNDGKASKQQPPEKPEIEAALAAAWDEIEEGANRCLQENKEKLQELYASDEKPDLIGHVEKDPDRPSTML